MGFKLENVPAAAGIILFTPLVLHRYVFANLDFKCRGSRFQIWNLRWEARKQKPHYLDFKLRRSGPQKEIEILKTCRTTGGWGSGGTRRSGAGPNRERRRRFGSPRRRSFFLPPRASKTTVWNSFSKSRTNEIMYEPVQQQSVRLTTCFFAGDDRSSFLTADQCIVIY